jgi:L-iditol 2-dehydrogenase
MKVARSHSPRDVAIEEADDPQPGEGDVVCRMVACGVCKSDVTDWYVERKRLPTVLGHELVGEVEAVGPHVTNVRRGDVVAVHHHTPCGECRRCRRGHETLCENFRATGLDPGGFAEKIRIPAELTQDLMPLEGLDPVAATWVEPLACVLRSQDRAGLKGGDALLVVGAGANGLLHIAAAHTRAVDVVFVREPRRERLELAEALGAEEHGNEQVDVAIVCTPAPEAIAAAAAALAPGGVLCLFAPPDPGAPLPLDGNDLFLRELEVRASFSATYADMRAAFALLHAGRIDPLPFVSHRLPLEQAARAFELTRDSEALKVVLVG